MNEAGYCIVVPHYDHAELFTRMLPGLLSQQLPIIVIDDGSPVEAREQVSTALAESDGKLELISLPENRGKGAAVIAGIRAAQERGYSHALQIDADGQHDMSSIGAMLAAVREDPECIICGRPVFGESVPGVRFYFRYLTLFFVRIETVSNEIQDAMCGFRVYPVASMTRLFERCHLAQRMAFDPEILVKALWHGIRLKYVPVEVRYPEDGRSHFRYVRDNVLISWMHCRLLAGALLRLPRLLWRQLAA